MKLLRLIVLILPIVHCCAQGYKPAYTELTSYQGLYHYSNNSQLTIAASPKDTLLYAIINQSRYPLKAAARDIFTNRSGDKITFLHDEANAVYGFATAKDTFALISRKVHFPAQMWYPRILPAGQPYHYTYIIPKSDKDGLATATIDNSGLDKALLATMMDKIVAGDYPNVHSILIAKDGKLVFEEYFYEYSRDSLHELRSATKSFVSALTGIAIQKGFIKSKNEKVLPYFTEYTIENNSDLKKSITIENLLTNQSGLDCDISNPQSVGNETTMDYSDDWVQFTLNLPMGDVPGGKGMYCSGNPVTLGRILEKATHKPLPQFADETLFKPLGIKKYKWNFKPSKANAEDFCQVYLTPRSMLKFGLLYANDGLYNGKQLVPREWVQASMQKHSVVQGVDYGYLWWLKYLDANGVRYNGVAAQGNGGQKIFIFKEQGLVIVITGGNYNAQSPSNELIAKYILPAFNKK